MTNDEIKTAAKALRSIIVQGFQKIPDADITPEFAVGYPYHDPNGHDYAAGEKFRAEDGTIYKVVQAHTSQPDWTPENAPSLYTKVLTSDSGEPLPWIQPESTNPYQKGDRVTYNGHVWESTCDNNVWAPGVYGWEIVDN